MPLAAQRFDLFDDGFHTLGTIVQRTRDWVRELNCGRN
jgi:hypothetical protein